MKSFLLQFFGGVVGGIVIPGALFAIHYGVGTGLQRVGEDNKDVLNFYTAYGPLLAIDTDDSPYKFSFIRFLFSLMMNVGQGVCFMGTLQSFLATANVVSDPEYNKDGPVSRWLADAVLCHRTTISQSKWGVVGTVSKITTIFWVVGWAMFGPGHDLYRAIRSWTEFLSTVLSLEIFSGKTNALPPVAPPALPPPPPQSLPSGQ